MLAADEHTTGFFQTSATGAGAGLLAGDLVDEAPPTAIGPFLIVRELGRGGMGVVYEAQQEHPRRRVALKTLHPWLRTEQAAALFRFEAQALGDLLHPGIPQVYAADEEDGLVYLVMELVRGRPLDEALGPIGDGLERRIEVLARVCEAVDHAHQAGILHRDLKPQNILLTDQGQPKVLDFGIAGTLLEARAEQAAGAMGTLAYASPEQLLGRPTDIATDVYALGALGYELFTGVLPHDVRDLDPAEAAERKQLPPLPARARRPELPADLGWLLDRALDPDPAERPASAASMAANLRRVVRMEPLPGRGGWTYRAGLAVRRNRTRALGVAAVLAVGLAGLGGSGVRDQWAEQRRIATAEQQLEVLEANLAALAGGPQPDWDEAEALFDSFVSLPEVQGTPTLSTAWRRHADRRKGADRDGVLDALSQAWTLAPTPETTDAAATDLAAELNRLGRHASARQVLQTLPGALRADQAEQAVIAAIASRDLDGALAVLPPERAALGGVLRALETMLPTEAESVGAAVVELGQPPTPHLLTIEADEHVVLRTADGAETLGRIPHPEGFGVHAAQLFAYDGGLYYAGKPGDRTAPAALFRTELDPPGTLGPWTRLADLAYGTPTALVLAEDRPLAWIGESYPQRLFRALDLESLVLQVADPETEKMASDFASLVPVDLDGDGTDELAGSLTDWIAYDVRAWRRTDGPELTLIDSDQVGFVTGVARVARTDGPDLLAALKTDQRAVAAVFGEAEPHGPEAGVYVYGLEDEALVRLRRLPTPGPMPGAGSPGAGRPLTGDLDGDGRTDLAAPLLDYRRPGQHDLLLIPDVADPDARGVLLAGLWLQAMLDADGDGDQELLVKVDDGRLALLGTGDVPLPLYEDPTSAPGARLTAPDDLDPATAATWSRAERLLQLGLPDHAARTLFDLARRHGSPPVRARARHEAARLYDQLGDDTLASTTWLEALEDVRDPALERAIRQGAVETLTRRLELDQALDVARQDATGEPPSWLARAGSAPGVELLGSAPLDPRWTVRHPISLARQRIGWELDQFNRQGVLLETEVELTGDRLGLDIDLVTETLEPGGGLRIELVDPAHTPVLELGLAAGTGGTGSPTLEASCLADQRTQVDSVILPEHFAPVRTRIQAEWLAGPELRGCLVSWLPDSMEGPPPEAEHSRALWKPQAGALPTGPHVLRVVAGGNPDYHLAMRTRQELRHLVLHGARWPEPETRSDLDRGRHLLASGRFEEALPLLADSPADRALAHVRLGDREATGRALKELVAAGDRVDLAALYRVEGPFLGTLLAEAMGTDFPGLAVAIYNEPFVSQKWRTDLVPVALAPEFEKIGNVDFQSKVFNVSRAEILFRSDHTAQAIRLVRAAANAPPDPSHPNDLMLRVQIWTVLADKLAVTDPEGAVEALKEALALSPDPEAHRRTVAQFPKLAPVLERLEAKEAADATQVR